MNHRPCVSDHPEHGNQLTHCKNHILEFKETILHLKSRSKNNSEELVKALTEMQYEIMQRRNRSGDGNEKKTNTPNEEETVSNIFEDFKLFLPHLRKVKRIYPKVIMSQGKTDVSFALGVPTVSRGNHAYLNQVLNSIVTGIKPWEEDAVVIVSVTDSNEDYVKSVGDMVTKKFYRQVMSGSLEVISVPDFFYPSMLHEEPTNDAQKKQRKDMLANCTACWRVKQVLDSCVLMAYAQPKATYYLQLQDDIIAKKMYFAKLTKFVSNMTSNDWFCIQFSALGFTGKLFKSKDLPGFLHFFLMFYKEKHIDLLLDEIFHIKIGDAEEKLEKCIERKKEMCMQYNPSLFQHVGMQSPPPQPEQHFKKI